MKLYLAPGSCSLADHIALHEAGIDFDRVTVDLKAKRTDDGRDYAAINPKGYVPALEFDDGQLLTENIAILSWVADQAPQLAPTGEMARSRLLEMLAFISTEIHKAFKPLFSQGSTDAEKTAAKEVIGKRLEQIAAMLKGDYLFGPSVSVADAYLFTMLTWAKKNDIALPDNLSAFFDRMSGRPAVTLALHHEGLDQQAA
jgi:glutathione S-transferase